MATVPITTSHFGRELARLMAALQVARDPHKHEMASCVDHVFVRHCHKPNVLEVLRPIVAGLVADGDANASRLDALARELENMEEEAYDDLGWAYRDERVALMHAH